MTDPAVDVGIDEVEIPDKHASLTAGLTEMGFVPPPVEHNACNS